MQALLTKGGEQLRLDIPANWHEIPLSRFIESINLIPDFNMPESKVIPDLTAEEYSSFYKHVTEYISFWSGQSIDVIEGITANDLFVIYNAIQKSLSDDMPKEDSLILEPFEAGGITFYYPEKDYNNVTAGDFMEVCQVEARAASLDKGNFKVLPEIMARLLLPFGEKKRYTENEYKDFEKALLTINMQQAYVFFCYMVKLNLVLSVGTILSLNREAAVQIQH